MKLATDQAKLFKMNKQRTFSKGRRRSRSLGGLDVNGLCESIPTSMAPSVRLEKLIELSFQHSISTLQREFFVKEGFNLTEFRAKSDECCEKLQSILQERNLLQMAVSNDISTPEIAAHEKVVTCGNDLAKIQKEIQDWDSLVSAEREALDKTLEHSPAPITADINLEHKYADYSAILQKLSSENESIDYQIAKLPAVHNLFINCLHLGEKYKSLLSIKSAEHFKKSFSGTPRTTIKKLVAAHKLANDTAVH